MKTLLMAAGATMLSFAATLAFAAIPDSKTASTAGKTLTASESPVSQLTDRVNEIADKEGGDSAFNYIVAVYEADTTRADAAALLAQLYFAEGYNDDALDWIDRALINLSTAKDLADAQALKANVLYTQGLRIRNIYGVDTGLFAEGLPLSRQAYEYYDGRNEFNAEAFSVYATLLWQEDSIDKAIPVFEEVIKYTPDHYSGYCGLSHCYRDKGDLVKALGLIDEAMAKCGDKRYLYFNRAQLCEMLKRYDEAIDAGISGVEIGDGLSGDILALVAGEDGEFDKVMAGVNARIPGSKTPGRLALLQAQLYYNKEDNANALKMVDKAMSLEPKDSEVLLSAVYYYNDISDDQKKTLELCDRFISLFPDDNGVSDVESIKESILHPEEVVPVNMIMDDDDADGIENT